jgi:hypothetical protein
LWVLVLVQCRLLRILIRIRIWFEFLVGIWIEIWIWIWDLDIFLGFVIPVNSPFSTLLTPRHLHLLWLVRLPLRMAELAVHLLHLRQHDAILGRLVDPDGQDQPVRQV